jgi:hypothetical protein
MTRGPSRRFDQNWLTMRLVPFLLIFLVLALIGILVLIGLSLIGAI